ncbi:hypothetical protein [Paenibacillus sp. YN15]|uniref:hypothetical protein n=1 Tax=Paenibacillus sp. YN15 TaxID=1742774 RepID=UPI000DCF619A|nr:hypothetical protein [Paenibacillus sp. YN15]RAU91547.1 hypothetical protein DQG13_29305 [Paenibacillus sp. YN15]
MKKMFSRFKLMVEMMKGKKGGMIGAGALAFAFALAATSPTPAGAAPIEFTGTALPFNVADMLSSAVNFLTLYGEWILLALAVIFAPVLYGLAMKLVSAAKKRSSAGA